MLSATTLACHGRVQREGEVVHVVADWLEDLSGLLRSVGELDTTAYLDGSDYQRDLTARLASGAGLDAPTPLPQSAPGIRVPTRDFR